MTQNPTSIEAGSFSSEPLQDFQLSDLSIAQKSSKQWGLRICQSIDATLGAGVGNGYLFNRNTKFQSNRNYANGRVNMQRFMDQLDFNGKFNYANINWQAIHIVNRIISGQVGKWMQRREKITVQAIDSLSVEEKNDEYEHIEFIVANKKRLEELQAQSGVQLIPQEPIPADQEELNIWMSQFLRLPEEILFEIGINNVLRACGMYDTLKNMMLHDSAEVGLIGTYTYMDEEGVIHVDRIEPENMVYSYSKYNDFRDTTWRGRIRPMKVSEIRKKYGVAFGGTLTEKQIQDIAATSRNYTLYDNLRWINDWDFTYMRPYDDWNVDVIEFELRSPDANRHLITKTKSFGNTIIREIDAKPAKINDNEEYVEKGKWNIYRGVYVRSTQMLLEWELKKNMIRPQDPRELGEAEFSYSFYMYQNYDMVNMAVPEKIQEPVDQMILARLKMQQLVATMRPVGSAINWDALQNIDYGLGDQNRELDVVKMYNQTGNIYYRSRDAEGNPIPIPIVELQNSGFLNQLQGLILLYDKHYQILKDELGEDPNLIQQALTPRVTSGNVENAQASAEYATDYMYDAWKSVMKDTARKVGCLLKNSVTYGSQAYRDLVSSKDDLDGRVFTTDIDMMPTDFQVQKLEAFLNTALASNPELIKYLDPFQIVRIARENVKLAELYIRSAQKKMYVGEMQAAQANSQQQAEVQMQANKAAEEEKRKTFELEGNVEMGKANATGQSQSRVAIINMVSNLLLEQQKTGQPIPANAVPLVDVVLKNMIVPLAVENKEIQEALVQQMEEEEQQRKMQEQGIDPEIQAQAEQEQQMQQQQPQQMVA